MKIEHIQRREGGTVIPMGKATYHFKPEAADGPHLADVTDEGHAERFLSITEGFRLPAGERPVLKIKPAAAVAVMSNHPTTVNAGGKSVPLADVVAAVIEKLELNVATWNAMSELERFDHVEAYIQSIAPEKTLEEPDTADLRAADIPQDQKLQGAPEDAVSKKPMAQQSDKQLRALAEKFGVNKDLPRADLIKALSAYPV